MKYLITGGAGSLGTRLTKYLLGRDEDSHVIIYSRDEGKQATLRESLSVYSDRLTFVVGDVRDVRRFEDTIERYRPEYVIHAAAMKRIDDAELNVEECIKTNVDGSYNVASVCAKSDFVLKCCLVSTDKACDPVNVYGATKFLAERIFSNFNSTSEHQKFFSVRYGNVIASRGSFIPLWIEKLRSNSVVFITDESMTRFLFTLDDAVKFIMTSFNMAQGGEVFVPFLKSFTLKSVYDVLVNITHTHDTNTKIVLGPRPGEKMHESMVSTHELSRAFVDIDKDIVIIQSELNAYDIDLPNLKTPLNSGMDDYLCHDTKLLEELIIRGIS